MEKELRNTLRNIVTQCRKQLEQAITEMLQGQFGIHPTGEVEDAVRLAHLSAEDQEYRERILAHLKHIRSLAPDQKKAVEQLTREAAFTHLNRLCAYKLMATRGLIDDPVGRLLNSRGFKFYLAEHPDDERLWSGGEPEKAYKHYLEWLNGTLSEDIGALFSAQDLASGLYPPHRVIESVLALLNSEELKEIWSEDETIGWVYQYFTPKEQRDQARDPKKGGSAAPRNSYELAFRNQFFTPRYVVEFLTDNTLGRTWYEMRRGDTSLATSCRYLVRRPNEVFLAPDETAPETSAQAEDLSKEELLNQPVYIPHRAKKDPREIRVLDPACGSGHFLLYCFDLLQVIYEEAYADEELGPRLRADFPDAEDFRRRIPALILEHNLHGIDIDLRATQIAGLALWLRAQRAWQEMGIKREERPRIQRSHIVCAEPMPGEEELLEEFIAGLPSDVPAELLRAVFREMKLAGEAGSLLRIEDSIREPIAQAKAEIRRRIEEPQPALFDKTKLQLEQAALFDWFRQTDEQFWDEAETKVVNALREYARQAGNGRGLLRRLFAGDAEQGFAFIDICRQKFDVALMNPPFGDASIPSKPYIDEIYGDTKGDVYKAFVECFQDRLVPGGLLGIISSRTGFFLGQSANWRERIVLRLYRPLLLADFGMGVLDAMVETAAYVLRSLTAEEDRRLTLQLVPELERVPTDRKDVFSTKKYEETRGLKRHQANGELRRLLEAGFITPVEGRFPRWSLQRGVMARVQVPHSASYPPLVCLRLLGEEDKGSVLREILSNAKDARRFVVPPEDFSQVPNAPFAYWVSHQFRQKFKELEPLHTSIERICVGLSTKDDFRFLRLNWEVDAEKQNSYWYNFVKGGAFARYYADPHLVIDWENDGARLKAFATRRTKEIFGVGGWSRWINNWEYYFRAGLTWSRRSQIGLSLRILPQNCIFSEKGPIITDQRLHLLQSVLGLCNSVAFQTFVSLQMVFGAYEAGIIQRTPVPDLSNSKGTLLGIKAKECVLLKRDLDTAIEISHGFYLPALMQSDGEGLSQRLITWQQAVIKTEQQLTAHQHEIDDIAFHLYGISDEDQKAIEAMIGNERHIAAIKCESEINEVEEDEDNEQTTNDLRALTTDLISYFVGCIFGRWDVRFAIGEKQLPELPDPFAPLPVCAPGALQGEDGLPLSTTPLGYPLRMDWDGILVDDPDHQDDIICRVRNVFELIWKDRAEAIEREACELLGVRELRDYFRKPGAGGFWADHINRYSKSRRKAPIYWLLQSSKKNYGLWLYYHQLDKDILYKTLLNYVEPKLRLEENHLTQLRQQRAGVGAAGREAKQLEKQLDRQEALLSELYDFRDKLKRAAELGLEPDLNDGVVLNIAPLWELVPWAEAKKYWEELKDGKYEWSSIGKQMREKGLVK